MINIISNNPYRQLGVYSTSPQKEVVANQGKMKAFLKVGKAVTFPLDLQSLLPPIDRTFESVSEASSLLVLPNERLKYAQFWFANKSSFDEIAIGKLLSGNIEDAIDIWSKKENVSSLQNRIVCYIICDKLQEAISCAEILYTKYKVDFVYMILGENATISPENLDKLFLDIVCSKTSINELINYITLPEWTSYISSQSIKPIIEHITKEIEQAKTSKGKGADARYQAGTKLMNNTRDSLTQLKQFSANSDFQFQIIADKLGTEILQCGIDYFNDSESPDAAHKAMKLQSYALSIVIGKMAKDRCKENVDILKKIIENLPPTEVFLEDKAIKEELRKFCQLPDRISHSVSLLNNTKPHLNSIKSKLGSTNAYYLKMSTQVVGNALHNLIEEVNRVQNDPTFKINLIIDKAKALSDIQTVLRSAWNAIKLMDSFDMEYDFKTKRYNANRSTLQGLCSQVGVSTYTSSQSTSSSSGSGCMVTIVIAIVLGILVSCI